MGVQGLFKELNKRGLKARVFTAAPETMRVLPAAQRRIVVDACSVAGFLYSRLFYGGNFVAMERQIQGFVSNFTGAGFRVTAVVDGALDLAKTGVWLQRRVREGQQMGKIHAEIEAFNRTHRSAPRASHAEATCTATWKSLVAELFVGAGCEVVMSPVEGDREAAAICLLDGCFGVVSDDSDMLVFGVPRVVRPNTIKCRSQRLTFEFFHADDVSKALGLPTPLLPLFALLSSNQPLVCSS